MSENIIKDWWDECQPVDADKFNKALNIARKWRSNEKDWYKNADKDALLLAGFFVWFTSPAVKADIDRALDEEILKMLRCDETSGVI